MKDKQASIMYIFGC